MSTSNKLLKLKRERVNDKTEKTSKKCQNKKLKSIKSNKNSNIEQKEKESIKSIDDDIDEVNFEENKPENSLGQLTRNFIQYIKTKGRINININDLENFL